MDNDRRKQLLATLSSVVRLPSYTSGYQRYLIQSILLLCRFSPDPTLDLRLRLFSDYDVDYLGRDVFSLFAEQRYEFFEISGESPETFLTFVNEIALPTCENCTLSKRNRVILFFIWLRTYPTYSMLSVLFNVSVSSVKDFILDSINVFDLHLPRYIRWLTVEEWERLRGNWPYMDVAVGAIDDTSHEIYKPKEHQEMYNSGHRKFHCLHSQVIIDNTGMIRHVESGFYGHQNDAQHYRLMTRIPDELPFPDTCFMLGDKIYPNGFPILTPYYAPQLRRRQGDDRRCCRRFNRYHRKYRALVEHAIGQLKVYMCVNAIWRHKRTRLPRVVRICAALVCRRKEIELIM